MNGLVLWITGLPGSGKSTIADSVKQRYPSFVILRTDDLRKVVTPRPSYSDEEREMVYRSIVYSAKVLSELGHDVIIDGTGNRRRWRDLARQLIPSYAEVYLRCSAETCRQREQQRTETHSAPKNIYAKGSGGDPVPGVNVAYEEPINPEVTIDGDNTTAAEAAEHIAAYLQSRHMC